MSIIAKYKFDKSIYENLIPEFNEGYTGYTISDEIDSENSNHVIRTIECDSLPTLMRFGSNVGQDTNYQSDNRVESLLEIIALNTDNLTSCVRMFKFCKNLKKVSCDINTRNITTLRDIFANCRNLTSIDVSNWDTSKVDDMAGMFYCCYNLTSLDVSKWDTSKVTYMGYMFHSCTKLTSLDVSNWDTSNVTDMNSMFYGCQSLTSLDVSGFNTSKVDIMQYMFANCHNLTSLDVSKWNIKNTCVTTVMLSGCGAKTIYMYDSDYASVNRIIEQLPQVDNAELYIGGIDSLGSVNLSGARAKNWSVINKYKVAKYKFDKSIYENLIPEFNEGYTGYTIIDEIDSENENHIIRTIIGNSLPTTMRFGNLRGVNDAVTDFSSSIIEIIYLNTTNLDNMMDMFAWCNHLIAVNTEGWDTSNVTDMSGMFSQCYFLTSIDVSNFDTSNVTYMMYMFADCNKLTSLDVSNFDTSKVNSMANMFYNCTKLTSLDVSKWNTSKVSSMNSMFAGCNNLTSLDVSKWDTGNVETMAYMFDSCNNLTSIDVSNFDTKNLHYTTCMFYNCRSLTNVDVSRWNTRNLATIFRMFHGCENMEKVDLSTWDLANVKPSGSAIHAFRVFGGMKKLKELIVPKSSKHKFSYIHDLIAGCLELECLDLNGLNINSVMKMPDMSDKPDMIFDIVSIFNDESTANNSVPKLKRIKIDDNELLKELLRINQIPDRVGKEAGQIVTAIRDQIDEETIAALTAKNWVVKDLVAQYRYDANTYENLLPEFNAEFTSDKYEIHDSVSEIVIDDIQWEQGNIHNGSGINAPYEQFLGIRTGYINLLQNVEYKSNIISLPADDYWKIMEYDENKLYLGYQFIYGSENFILQSPNTKYVRFVIDEELINEFHVTAKLVTRSIESKNGDLPTMLRFGILNYSNADIITRASSLLKVHDLKADGLLTMENMFHSCTRVESINATNWNTSQVTIMSGTFAHCYNLSTLDVSNFDTSNVTTMYGMFSGGNTDIVDHNKLLKIDISKWDTRNVTEMSYMFYCCRIVEDLDLSNLNTSQVINMDRMLYGCCMIKEFDLSSFDTSNVTNMEQMLFNCNELTMLNLSNWDMTNVENTTSMFYQSNKLNSVIMYNSNSVSINKIISVLETKSEANKGALVIAGVDDRSLVNVNVAESKFWIVKSNLVAKYTFNKAIYDNFLPDMGTDFTSYTIIDEVSSYNVNHITRMIVSDFAPQIMKFGADGSDFTKPKALMEVMHVHMDSLIWCYNMFRGCQYVTAINLKNVNTDLMTNMTCMFSMCYNITTLDVSSFNTSQITDMKYVFDDCQKLVNIKGLENWDVSNVTSFSNMFDNCQSLTSLSNICDWDVSEVTNMQCTFNSCYSLTSLDVSNWDTRNVTDMTAMFQYCTNLTSLNVSNFETINVTKMDNMFCNCYLLSSLDVSGFDTSNVTRMDHMFRDCHSLTSLDISNFNTINVKNMGNMFQNCYNLTSLDISNFNTSNVTDMISMFYDCNSLTSLDVSNFNTSNVTTMHAMFLNCKNLTSLDVSNFDTRKVTNMSYMFHDCSRLTSLDLSNFDTSNVIHMHYMFFNCNNLTSLDVSKWNTRNATSMYAMFHNCKNLTSLDVSNFDTSNVTSMYSMFANCHNITSLDVSNWDTSKVLDLNDIFDGCYELKILNINNLNVNSTNFTASDITSGVRKLDRIYMNDVNTIKSVMVYDILNRSVNTPGYIVTTVGDQLDQETKDMLASNNWFIKDLVAQYRYDANTYEDLMPEFNPEFTEDMYEVHDSVSEIVIDNFDWEDGAYYDDGIRVAPTDKYPNRVHNGNGFINIIPNTQYKINRRINIYWFDKNKNLISYHVYTPNNELISPSNAYYMTCYTDIFDDESTIPLYSDLVLTAKIVTRSIESKNGDLPTLMRFGSGITIDAVTTDKELALLKVFGVNTNELITAKCMFQRCERLSEINNIHISNKVNNTSYMFENCILLKTIDVSNWDVSNVIDMQFMFNAVNTMAMSLTSLDVSNWDVGKVTNMAAMFGDCEFLTSLDVSKWDTGNVTSMGSMFQYCRSLTSLDVSNWDTSNVLSIGDMFSGCQSLTSIDVSNWDTSSVTHMHYIFYDCTNLTSLDVSNFDTSNVIYMNHMFTYCNNLKSLDVSNWDTSNVTRMNSMFYGCKSLSSLDVSNFDTSNVTNMYAMFYSCNSLTSLDVSKWDTSKVTSMGSMFHSCSNLTSLDVSNFNTSDVTDMSRMFAYCNNLTSLDLSNFDTIKVTTMNNMFRGCKNLTSIDVSNFNTSEVTDMGAMFAYCESLTSLDVSNFDTSNVTLMAVPYGEDAATSLREGMFKNCSKITSLDVSNWDTSKVTDMGGLFWSCISLTSLDVSNFDTSNVTNLTNMFDDCYNLTRIDGIENWVVDNVDNFNAIFNDCWKLRNLDLSRWNVKHEARITGTFTSNASSDATMGLVYLDIRNWEIDESNVHYTSTSTGELVRVPIIADRNTKLKYIRNDVASTVDWLVSNVLTRTTDDPGYIITEAVVSNETIEAFAAKNWNVVRLADMNTVDIAIYKFDKSIYKSLIPEFDNNFADWFMDDVIEDEVNAPNIVTRTIRSMGGLPTLMRFGNPDGANTGLPVKYKSLINVLYINAESLLNHTYMFNGCLNLQSIPKMNINNKTNVNHMFCLCSSLSSLDVSGFDTSNVNHMSYMFYECRSLTSLTGLNSWDTSKVTTMACMFSYCTKLTSLDVSNFNTSKVTTMQYMFWGCNNLTSLDVSNFDTSNVTKMEYMFSYCESLTSLDVSNWDTSNVTDMNDMFHNCKNLTSLDVSNFDTSKVTRMDFMFSNCQSLTSLDVSNFDTTNVTNMADMFSKCNKLTSLDVSSFNTSKVKNMYCMFQHCNNLTSLDVSNWNTSNVTIMCYMFWDCYSLTSLDVSNWNTSNVNSMNHMFVRCRSLTSLDVSNWNTSKVTDMDSMFWECSSLTSLDVSNFDTSNVTNMRYMFYKCYALIELDVSNFDTSNVTVMYSILYDCGLIADIGMIYCDFKTVEKVAKQIPTTNHTTIWVGNHIDINGLPQYDHITYKVYEVEDKLEVELSSPLLEGDRLEIIDGDLYHYHNAGIMNLRGNEPWYQGNSEHGWIYRDGCALPFYVFIRKSDIGVSQDEIRFYKTYNDETTDYSVFEFMKSDNLSFVFGNVSGNLYTDSISLSGKYATNNYISIRKNGVENVEEFKSWLKANPVTLLYKLANPYYELVKPNVGLLNAEQGLYLNISDSVVPVVNHHDLCTLKLNYLLPNVEYKVKFKANNPGSIAINLGGTLVPLDVVEGWNEVMVTTPETLVDEYLKVNGSEGIKIQNVMVIDSNKDFDYFKGMNNTFDEIPVKNICKNRTLTYTHGVDEEGVSPQGEMNVSVGKGKVVTVMGRVSNNPDNLPISINLYNDTGRATGKNLLSKEKIVESLLKKYGNSVRETVNGYDVITTNATFAVNSDIIDLTTLVAQNTAYTLSFDCKYVANEILDYNNPCGNTFIFKYIDGTREDYSIREFYKKDAWFNVNTKSDPLKTVAAISGTHYENHRTVTTYFNLDSIQLEKGDIATAYEPFRNYVNDEPVYIDSNNTTALVDESLVDLSATDGYFAITIRADRDYANRIGFNVGDASSCEANDQVTITDLMVFEGDILDCQPTTYVDPADTRYLVEYKSIGNPFGFGKNKLI